jgi:hypothetical protein
LYSLGLKRWPLPPSLCPRPPLQRPISHCVSSSEHPSKDTAGIVMTSGKDQIIFISRNPPCSHRQSCPLRVETNSGLDSNTKANPLFRPPRPTLPPPRARPPPPPPPPPPLGQNPTGILSCLQAFAQNVADRRICYFHPHPYLSLTFVQPTLRMTTAQ